MALRDLSSTQLERVIELIQEKESLQAKLERINQSLTALETGGAVQATASPRARPGRRKRRGKLKEGILKALADAGKEGLSVKDLAEKLGAKFASVSIWFYTTGKKVKGIAKVGTRRYAYSQT